MIATPLKVVFAGTPDFAAAHLQSLIDSPHHICGVYSQPDRPSGRGRKLTASPVKQLALDNGLLVCQPETLKTADARQMLRSFEADVLVVVAYGIILPAEILAIPRLGCINVHASLLPRWRGAAPIQRAIEAGDEETGVTIMQMDEGLDTGDMLFTSRTAIAENDTSETLFQKLMQSGAVALTEALDKLSKGELKAVAQDERNSRYARKLRKQAAAIDWPKTASQLARKIRAFYPWPGCYVSLDQQKMKIDAVVDTSEDGSDANTATGTIISADEKGLRVACSEGSLLIRSLQMPGKKMTVVSALLNAYKDRFKPGQQFDR